MEQQFVRIDMSTIAIVGRPNVGKSTLFNRLIGGRKAIVDDKPGITRDRLYGILEWRGREYTVIDTGGFVPDSEDVFEKAIREQAEYAVDESDAVLLVVDGSAGVHPVDNELANIIRQKSKKVVIVVNKIDDEKHEGNVAQFSELGIERVIGVSAQLGRNIGDMLDEVARISTAGKRENKLDNVPRIAIVGRPNVGKSSLANLLLGSSRSIVTNVPGTTRDSVDSLVSFEGRKILVIDTAGLKKKSKIKESVEFFSILRTFQAVERSDATVVLFDASIGVEKQDLQIVEYALEHGKPAVIGVNKWDLIDKKQISTRQYEDMIRSRLRIYDHVPIVFLSVLKNQRVNKLIEVSLKTLEVASTKIRTSELNKYLLPLFERMPPFSKSGKEIKIKYVTQIEGRLPTFIFFTNYPDEIPVSYRRFIENKIREKYGFSGIPFKLAFRKK
ncbi:MAG: ribosome biogenesis GTPase Der [Candidatus Kryptoniota bacterium]